MRGLVLVGLLFACGPGLSSSKPDEYRHPQLHDFAAQLTRASQQRDVAGVRQLLRDSVTVAGVWFRDVKCIKQFAIPGEVRGTALDEFARCLTTIQLTASARSNALPDVVVLTYEPGIELEARFVESEDGPWLAWIGYVARRDIQDALPTISASTLETLRVSGERHPPIQDADRLSQLEKTRTAFAWLKVCIDIDGKVTGAHVRQASSPTAARMFAATATAWQFQRFVGGTQPMPVCSMVHMVHPPEKAPKREVLPLPLPASPDELTSVPSAMLTRIRGSTLVTPADKTRLRIQQAGIARVLGAFQYCIDEGGRVFRVALLRSTGLADYDRELINTIGTWVYRPFLDEGRAVPVCSSVHFAYTQRGGRQAGTMQLGRVRR